MRQELEELKGLLVGMSVGTPIVGCASDWKSSTVPSMGTMPVHTTNSDNPDASVEVEQGTSATQKPTKVESASPIVKWVRNDPPAQHPLQLQTSPYVHPVTHVYKPRKH